MPAKRKTKRQHPTPRKKSRSVKLARKASTRRTTARTRPSKRTARRQTGSISEAAAKVAKSGAILVGHTGQRVAAAAAYTAKSALASAVQSAAELTTSLLRSPSGRKAKRR